MNLKQITNPKIALIKPYFDMFDCIHGKESEKRTIKTQIQSYPPLGLCYISSYLKHKGITHVEILDCVERKWDSVSCADYILKNHFNVVGISVSSFSLKEVKSLISNIKNAHQDIKIIIGGVHVTYDPEILKALKADYGIRGDGEESFYKILTDFNHSIEGLVYEDNSQVRFNEPAVYENLDDLPLPEILNHNYKFPIYSGGRIYIVSTTRGCPYKCIFCGLPNIKHYRSESPEKVMQQLELLKAKGYAFVDFKDDCFTFERKRVEKLCDLMIQKDLNLKWSMQTRADLIDSKLLALMKRAGCIFIQFGIESGVPRIRNTILKKNLSQQAIITAFKLCKEQGIKSAALMMLGSPAESLQDMKDSMKFIKTMKPDYVDVLLTIPIVGSALYDVALKEKKITKNVWNHIVEGFAEIPVYIPEGVTLSQMQTIQSQAYKRFYFNFGKLFKEIGNIQNLSDFKSKINIAYNLLKNY